VRAALLVVLIALAGCLLPDPPAPPRWFAVPAPDAGASGSPVAVRLGVVRSPLHLREAMTWRRSEVEVGFYDQRRWTELPATYVERALTRELFGDGAPIPAAGDVPVLTVELRAFEEVLAPTHEARVALAVELADARCIRLRRTFAASRPIEDGAPATVARAIGDALDEAVRATGAAVRDAVAARGRCDA
jgi:ABC-type uncharacterized transport system auxiliary subunit